MELVKCGRCGVSLTPASCFPPGSRQPRRGVIFLLFSPRIPTRARARACTHVHTHSHSFSRCHSAVAPILVRSISDTGKNPLQTPPRYFFVIPHATGRRGGSGAISFPTHLHMTIVCMVGESDGPRSSLQAYLCKNVSHPTHAIEAILLCPKSCQNILSSTLQMNA